MRFPTEAEWEYAARAGSSDSNFSNVDSTAWFNANRGKKSHAVGQKQFNAWGLNDMLGNHWEWVADWYVDRYQEGAAIDPRDPASGKSRVSRGGSRDYDSGARACRLALASHHLAHQRGWGELCRELIWFALHALVVHPTG